MSHIRHVLSGGVTGSPPFWGRDLGFVGGYVQESGGVHVGFLRNITGQRAVRQKEGTWRQVAEDRVLEKAGTQSLGAYIDRRQATVAEWVILYPMLEVCNRQTGYKGGGRLRDPWWRQTAAIKQLSATLKCILAAEMEQRWKSGRRGGGGGNRDADDSDDGAGSDGSRDAGTQTGDTHVGELSCVDARRIRRESGQGRVRAPPPRRKTGGGRRRVERVKKSRVSYVTINDRAQVRRGHCLRLEHHHLVIWTHPTDRWTGIQQQQRDVTCQG